MSDSPFVPVLAGVRPDMTLALKLLGEADTYARALGRSSWDFAVELEELRRVGLTSSGLRWLVCKGYAEHATEITPCGQNQRSFRPEGQLTISLRTCAILTGPGVELACRLGVLPSCNPTEGGLRMVCESITAGRPELPTWDGMQRHLLLGRMLVKAFRQPAPNQERILSAFQEEGWPARIDDPLPPLSEIDPKQHLRDTIRNLNRSQSCRLIRFRADGTGSGVVWSFS